MTRVRDEHLRAVEHVLVAAAARPSSGCPDTSEPAPGSVSPKQPRIGASSERAEPLLLLLLGAGDQDRASGEAVRADRRADARAAPVELLADEHPVEARQLRPTERLRHVQVHQADLVRLGDDVGRMGLMLVALGRPAAGSPSRRTSARARAARFCSSVRANETPPATPVSTVAICTAPEARRLTSQSISVDGEPAPPVKRPPRSASRTSQVWRWHAASGTRKALLDGVDWAVQPGERWALLGPNGAGKTTLLTLAAAVDFPSRGTVEILGRDDGTHRRGAAARVDRLRRRAARCAASRRC